MAKTSKRSWGTRLQECLRLTKKEPEAQQPSESKLPEDAGIRGKRTKSKKNVSKGIID